MTRDRDPLDELIDLMDQVTPAPDTAQKATTLARANEIFAATQGSTAEARPTSASPIRGVFRGAASMFAKLTTKPALAASTAIVAVGLVAFLPMIEDGVLRPLDHVTDEFVEYEEEPVIIEPEPMAEDAAVAPALEVNRVRLAPQSAQVASDAPMGLTGAAPAHEPELNLFGGLVLPETGVPPSPVVKNGGTDGQAEVTPSTEQLTAELSVVTALRESLAHEATQHALRIAVTDEERVLNNAQADLLAAEVAALTAKEAELRAQIANSEEFANEAPNPVKVAAEEPVSTFSIDVDTASYSVIRSSLMGGYLPDPDAVRIEELVNYFPYDYAAPEPGEGPFKPTVSIQPTPWNPDTQLMHIAIQGETPAVADRPPLNLVFLIDTSGSMDAANKLPLLKQSFRLMLGQLGPEDEVSIVTYAGSAGQVLAPTKASERSTIFPALDRLDAGGSTAGQAGLQQAYAVAEGMATEGEVTRVILATDGDFNVGIHDPDALKDFIANKRNSGTYLSVLGFGRGNLDDATMQALAQNGNGQAAYIDTLSEAQKVLVDQLTGALFPIANDVKIQVEFNPATVAEYRLIGYETRALRREDFNNDKVDAGEIGAGHSVTAIYEVTPVGSPAVLNDPLRYSAAEVADSSDELAFLRLRYKEPGDSNSQLLELPVAPEISPVTDEQRFAAAIAGFGQLLQNGTYTGDWTYADAIALANGSLGEDPFAYRREAVQLMRLAESLSNADLRQE